MGSGGNGRKFLLSSLRMLLAVVFLGYMMIWFMKPTNTFYTRWFPDIHSKTNSTYFGELGANILIYMFPVLLIAVVASFYVHLAKKHFADSTSNKVGSSHFASWKKPVLVRGPLGIVSWTEVSFLAMFIALLLWSFASYLHGMFAFASREAAYERLPEWEAKLQNAGLSIGLVGNTCLAFVFFPVTRGSSILQLLGLTSEASIKYHIWLGHISITLFTAHGLSYIIFWAKTHQISQMLTWDKFLVSNVAGEIALLSGLIMWITSIKPIRRKIFELFFYTHHLYILFVVFYVFHVGFSSSCIVLAGFYLFLIDRFLRLLQSQQRVRLISARILPCRTVELNFAKSPALSYNPTSSLFINVSNISRLQWHPFTITSNSKLDPDQLSIVIKSEGSWSSKLYQLFIKSPLNHLEVSIEGPYGPSSAHFMRHDMLVMICGGSGITPFISTIREILFISNTNGDIATPKLFLVCAFKKSEDLTMLDLILPVTKTNIDISRLQLQIEAYITRDKEFKKEDHKLLRTIWFKRNALDTPVCSVLGPKSWLWLGAIISASFLTFLVLIGILTRYYVYPIDHNTDTVYSAAAKSALGISSVCVSITLTASAAFLWNKKQNAKQMRQIQHTDTPTPATESPRTELHDEQDIELESFPQQSLLQATKVHVGERPNIKKILMEREEDSVGVLVSGPKSLRQEVAQTCSTGLGNNLSLESFSFSW